MVLNPRPPRRRHGAEPTARDLQKVETMRRLQDAARDLIREHGFDSVSLAEIGQKAGVTPTLISAHFGSKSGLLYSLVVALNAGQFEAALQQDAQGGSATERLTRALRIWCQTDLSDPKILAAAQALSWIWTPEVEEHNAKLRGAAQQLLARIVEAGQAAGEFRNLPRDRAVAMLWAIYTWGLRPAVFADCTWEECAAEITAQCVELLSH